MQNSLIDIQIIPRSRVNTTEDCGFFIANISIYPVDISFREHSLITLKRMNYFLIERSALLFPKQVIHFEGCVFLLFEFIFSLLKEIAERSYNMLQIDP